MEDRREPSEWISVDPTDLATVHPTDKPVDTPREAKNEPKATDSLANMGDSDQFTKVDPNSC
jgi:hypothetical protein